MMELTEVSRRFTQAAGCDALYEVRDEAAGLHAFIALHDISRGPGFGGIRRLVYPSVQDAVTDVVELAEQMTLKTRFAELPVGGAKAVILDRRGASAADHAKMYTALGAAVESLGGAYVAGPEVGTGEADLALMRAVTRWVTPEKAPSPRSAARGVVLAIEAATRHIGLDDAVTGVIGTGSVGGAVARELAARGRRVILADRNPERAKGLAGELGVPTGDPVALTYAEIGVLAPCGVGPFVTHANVGALRCRIVCGAANVQLEDATLATTLAERGILYVPDFAANAGAVIEAVLATQNPPPAAQLAREEGLALFASELAAMTAAAVEAIGPRVASLLVEADACELTPLDVALGRLATS